MRLLIAGMLVAIGMGTAHASTAPDRSADPAQRIARSVSDGALLPSDGSYGKWLASQYNTANGA